MNWTKLKRIAAPTIPVLTVDDVKRHLNIAHSDEDTLIEVLIDVAAEVIDGPNGIGLALLPQQWRLSLDRLDSVISLPLHPVQSVQSVTVYPDGWTGGIIIEPESYHLDTDQRPARIIFDTKVAGWNAPMKIEFTAGYPAPADVPADLKHVIRLLVGHYYMHREATSEAAINEIPMAVASILQRHAGF
ncbi:head-tail connector protein [Sphingobium yanoikuyae]|uniref:head-tail connector protein n=1 Tax=Sphingobium yanoikuyae TaxID=13690 RepID=UPI0013775A5C|nr:head-tail connector protein [Sphingobium yanoikuyae]NBB38672.1 hypothetical protein [Sphingobium yanoikuyae]